EAARTPVYPLFIAFTYLLSGYRNWFIILSQCFLDALVALLIFSSALILIKNVHFSFLTGLLYSIHPHQALYTTQILSEILFTLLIAFFLVLFIVFLKRKLKVFIALSGIFLGIAILTRPIAFYFFIPILFIIFLELKRKTKLILQSCLIFLFSFLIVLTPWYMRNYITYRRVFLSTIGNWNIGYYNAAFVTSFKEKISLREAQSVIEQQVKRRYGISDEDYVYATDNPEICGEIASYGFEIIRENLGTYVFLHSAGFLHTFIPIEYAFLYKIFSSKGVSQAREADPVTKKALSSILRGKFISSIKTVFDERFRKFPFWFSIIWFSFVLFQLFIYFFAIWGLKYFFKNSRIIFLLFLMTILYFLLIPGPVGDSRFRVPVEPVIILLAGVGIYSMRKTEKGRKE
ncbi:glycosyltransferase family 39 protein, partial [candidate division WOR-3 bacterium]|nr:glycosyltransferase family 39 protein [candidate division WOR-3 bacterium]